MTSSLKLWIALVITLSLPGSLVGAVEIFRVDRDPYSPLTASAPGESASTVGRKSHIDANGDLAPADIHGTITPLDHVARSRIRTLKDHSQFTSFSESDGLSQYYGGGYRITLDLDALSAAIDSRQAMGVKIHRSQDLLKAMNAELDTILSLKSRNSDAVLRYRELLNAHLNAYTAMANWSASTHLAESAKGAA